MLKIIMQGIHSILNFFSGYFSQLLFFLILLFAFRPYDRGIVYISIWQAVFVLVFTSAIFNCNHSKLTKIISTCLGIPALITFWVDLIIPSKPLIIISLFLSLLVILPNYSFATPNTVSLIMCSLFFLMGLTSSTQIITYPAIMESTSPSIIGVSESISSVLVMGIGALSLPVFAWLNSHQFHWNQWMFTWTPASSVFNQAYFLIPASFLISCILSFLVRETYCRPYQES